MRSFTKRDAIILRLLSLMFAKTNIFFSFLTNDTRIEVCQYVLTLSLSDKINLIRGNFKLVLKNSTLDTLM